MRKKQLSGFPTRENALKDFLEAWEVVIQTELVPLSEAAWRISAKDLYSVNTLPVYRVSALDGIAVDSSAFAAGVPEISGWQRGREFDRADTGDDFPDCYDAVIPIEEVEMDGDRLLSISEDVPVVSGWNVRPRGNSLKEGELLIKEGMPIRPVDLASLAMGGIAMVPVRKKPRIAFIPTGSELIPAGMSPKRGENIDSNSVMVAQLLKELGTEPILFPVIRDDVKLLERALEEALAVSDLVIINGGTAKGGEDFNYQLLEQKGRILHHYVAAAPGRPLALGVIGSKPIINIPGPTVAAFFCMDWCVSKVAARMLGIPEPKRQTVSCVLEDDINSTEHMAILCLMEITRTEDGIYHAHHLPFTKVGLSGALAANGMYVSDVGTAKTEKGSIVEVGLLRGREFIEMKQRKK